MADYTITITNQLYCLGPDVLTPSLWGSFQWGGKWLYESVDLKVEIGKLIANAVTPSDDLVFSIGKQIDNSITPSEDFVLDFTKVIANTLAPTEDLSSETLKSGSWNYVFVRPSTNAENRTTATFSTSSNASTTWTSSTATSTTWS